MTCSLVATLATTEHALPAQGRADDIYDRIYERYQAYKANHDFVILEGSHRGNGVTYHVFGCNRGMAHYMEACTASAAAICPFTFSSFSKARHLWRCEAMLTCAKLLGLHGCLGLSDGPINIPSNRLEMNARVAAALSAPVLMVLDAPSDLTVQVHSQTYAPGCLQVLS